MSDAIKNAIEAMEFAQHAVGPFNRVATKKLRESIAELQAAQAQAVNQQLLEALEAAIKFIDSHVADPDITQEMRENYAALQRTRPYDVIAAAQQRHGAGE